MKKSANADINNLFRKFGGNSDTYKEIQQGYVDEKAQQNWPIVTAMEKEQAGAPVLKSAAVNRGLQRADSTGGSISAFPAKAEPQGKSSVSVQSSPSASAANTGSFMAHRGGVVLPAAPAASLFGRFEASVPPASAASPVPVNSEVKVQRSTNDRLDVVFSRLLEPRKQATIPVTDNTLRGLFGFLQK